MTDAGTRIDIVVTEGRPDQLLNDVGFLVGAATRGQTAHRVFAVLRLNSLELRRRVVDRLFPGYFLPRIRDLFADHRLGNAILVRCIAEGKAAFDTRMAMIGVAILVGNHSDHFSTLHFSLEGAAHTAVGTRGHHAVLGLPHFNDRFFHQRRRGACLDTGTARDAF